MNPATTERSDAALVSRLNWLRAGVLGANDGIVSTAGLVFGVAGATSDAVALFIAGVAGMVAGSLSMAGGEYVSVSTQRDTESAAGIAADAQTSPLQAAGASMLSFVLGALIPLLAIVFTPVPLRLPVTLAAVLLALAVTGLTSAQLSGTRATRPVLRNLTVGAFAMGITYVAGWLIGARLQ
ncbi:VIT1/CCC1 transporter family protein [Micropruina sp.]|uniref:VIT1/CCC1 transporter family protein n=1 Tax=Micropruina sp. TaxID=2737536 RepID=UPI0039E3F282